MEKFMDIRCYGQGLFPAHTSIIPCRNNSDTVVQNKLLLNGIWKFHFSDHVLKTPADFYEYDYNDMEWDDIEVPKCWQHQGYGQVNYLNCRYPFPSDPPYVPMESDVGCYRREFYISDDFSDKNIHLVFEGVCSLYYVWVNGVEVGFSQGSHLSTEFDITKYLRPGKNILAVKVHQISFASYLECQDMFRFNGIFRDVYLVAKEKCELYNVEAWSHLDEKYEDGSLDVVVSMMHPGQEYKVRVNLKRNEECILTDTKDSSERIPYKLNVKKPEKWTAETPELYRLEVELVKGGGVVEVYYINVGFREVEIEDGVFIVNGKPVKILGVNHHDMTLDGGYAMSEKEMEDDIILMKQFNINAVRTSHYPPATYFLDLCDKYGLYVIDEADVEAHGGSAVGEWDRLAEDEMWREIHVDRAERMIKRDTNHPSVIMWSLGNESGEGTNHTEMAKFIKSYDTSRPVHYECAKREENRLCLDVYSEMYPTLDVCLDYATSPDSAKPMFLCEYAHAMGNGPGALKEYVDLFRNYDIMMGGCIWEWADAAMKITTEKNEVAYRYGGDFGDWPNDKNFCCDGLCFPDRTPHVGMIHMKNIYGPVELTGINGNIVTLVNRYDFNSLSDVYIDWELVENGEVIETGTVREFEIPPHMTGEVEITYNRSLIKEDGECFLNLYFKTDKATMWAPEGHELCRRQAKVSDAAYKKPEVVSGEKLEVKDTTDRILIKSDLFSLEFSKISGTVTNYVYCGNLLMERGPLFNAYWATTDNDWTFGTPEGFCSIWKNAGLDRARNYIRKVKLVSDDGASAVIEVNGIYAAPSFKPLFRTVYKYIISADGTMEITIEARPGEHKKGEMLPCLPKVGTTSVLPEGFDNVTWYGLGPIENYSDKKDAAMVGKYEAKVDDLFEMHIMPQENGNRSEIRWVKIANDSGCGLHICGSELMNFSARHYTDAELDVKTHADELEKIPECIFHFDYKVSGVGTGSCGPQTLEKYRVKPEKVSFNICITPYKA